MAQVILFGGGDGGGIRITAHGIELIPPFAPALIKQLSAIAKLSRAAANLNDPSLEQQLHPIIGKLTNLAVTQIEAAAGPIDGHAGLVFQDDDGGFTCGSTGHPPQPFPWPIAPLGSLDYLRRQGGLDDETMTVLSQAVASKIDLAELTKDPEGVAKRLGLKISPHSSTSIRKMDLSGETIASPVDKEVLSFFRKTVLDGRYVREWATSPEKVATDLRIEISKEALDRIRGLVAYNPLGTLGPGPAENPVAIAVVVGIVIMLYDRPAEVPVEDRSGLIKI